MYLYIKACLVYLYYSHQEEFFLHMHESRCIRQIAVTILKRLGPAWLMVYPNTQALNGMEYLGLLKIQNAQFRKGPSYLPKELQWLDWHNLPSTSLPQDFEGENLVGLKLIYGKISQLWSEDKYLDKLKYLNLSYFKGLISTPNLIQMPYLEKLNLSNCKNLVGIHEPLGTLTKLRYLNLSHCSKLKSISKKKKKSCSMGLCPLTSAIALESITYCICGLRCLRNLNLSGCSKLETLPETLDQLETLEELLSFWTNNFSFHLSLTLISLPNVRRITRRPNTARNKKPEISWTSLAGLCVLKKLDLSDSDLAGEIAADIWQLSSLKELNLSRNNFTEFPSRISGLLQFKVLKLDECKNLEALPDLPWSIVSRGNLSPQHAFLRKVWFFKCSNLYQQSPKTSIRAADLLLQVLLQGHSTLYGQFSIVISGGKIPEWFGYQKLGRSMSVQLPTDWQDNIAGVTLSLVFGCLVPKSKLGVTFKLISPNHREYIFESAPASAASKMGEVCESDHLWMSYISFHLFHWTKVCGCLSISLRQEPWTKVRRSGIHLVYKKDLNTSLAAGSKELVVYDEGGDSEEVKEDIAALMVSDLNWNVDSIEQDNTPLANLRKSLAYKFQTTLSFDC
ncbi:unnamed protein product [Withania somnifera]